MFNLVYYHCHFFTDFYKRLICFELKPLLTVRKSDTFILWRACLLVVPAGLDPRTYSIGTLHSNTSVKQSFLIIKQFIEFNCKSGNKMFIWNLHRIC